MGELKYYTREETAEILGVSTRTVHRYVKAGHLRGYIIGDGWRFKPEDIDAFVTRKSNIQDEKEGE